NGHLLGCFGMQLDITARKLAEKGLIESEAKFRQIAENIRDVFWMFDLNTDRMSYVSPAYEAIFGRSQDALYEDGSDWMAAVHPEDLPWVRKTYLEAKTKGSFDSVYRVRRRDGGVRWLHDRGFLIRNAAGEPSRLVGIAEDVTEIKESEEALRESEKRLSEALRRSEDRVVQLEDQARDRQ